MNLSAQIILLRRPPDIRRMDPVANPPVFAGGNLVAWLRAGQYRGNKPFGGLWTSTHTPDQTDPCDWALGLRTNAAIRAAVPPGEYARLNAYRLEVRPDAKVLTIDSLEEAQEFSARYRLAPPLPFPPAMRAGPGRLLVPELTDWAAACRDHDGIRLGERGADEVAYAQTEGTPTAFGAWHCESTLWGRWVFVDERS